MTSPLISILLAGLTVLSIVANVIALRRLTRSAAPADDRRLTALLAIVSSAAAALYAARWGYARRWQPIESHVDGLLLIAAMLGATILFTSRRGRLFGLTAFALPMLTVILAWAVCAGWWTYRPFNIQSLQPVWIGLHLGAVYLGTFAAALAAVAGAMYLYAQARLRRKAAPALDRLASLETIERLNVWAITVGFALLTLGLFSGVVIYITDPPAAGNGSAAKLFFAVGAWAIYLLLMPACRAAVFRGGGVAWISILGFLVLLAVHVVLALPATDGGAA